MRFIPECNSSALCAAAVAKATLGALIPSRLFPYIFLLFSLILSFCHSRRTYPPALYLPLHFFASFLVFLTSKQFIYYTLSFFLLSFLLLSTTIIFNPSVLYKGNLISVFYGNLTLLTPSFVRYLSPLLYISFFLSLSSPSISFSLSLYLSSRKCLLKAIGLTHIGSERVNASGNERED
ncbi:unnamed protein product [Acanthosepion pharaonis]|uniref:Uncharacterized protein n=1 Tax=Acanthosepion pharaonis TaxID=158019 RepID=A0A812CGW0_ACAPH|nr:unnamed protein product [Sepia pharaonis]